MTAKCPIVIVSLLEKLRHSEPKCWAAGLVDISSSTLLDFEASEPRAGELRDLAAGAAEELLTGRSVEALRPIFDKLRHERVQPHTGFRDLVIVSSGLVHIFQRCRRDPNLVLLCVCETGANLAIVMSTARQSLDDAELAA